MSIKSEIPSVLDILKSPEFTGEEVLDQKAFQIRTVIKSGKHGKVSLCESADDENGLEVAIKSELIKSPKNPHSRPYREFFILKQLGRLNDRPEFYANPRWIGFIQILDWFKAKTDQVRITSMPSTPMKTPTKPVIPQTNVKPVRSHNMSPSAKQAPRTAPRPAGNGSRLDYGDENEDVGALSNQVTAIHLTPSKRSQRVSATPTPKRVVSRTPLLQASSNRQREIKLQEGNLVLEKADATLYAMRNDMSFEIWRDILFQILYALYIAQTEYEFVHHDLHLQNVLLKRLRVLHVDGMDDVEANMGVFQLGDKKWYSKGPWIAKLSDFGLSRIKLVDGDGSVVYDLQQPLFEAFMTDRDVLKILDEFSRVKIPRWLNYNDCVEAGVKVSQLKESWFHGPEQSIALDDVLSVLQPAEVIGKLEELVTKKQKSMRQIRSAIRKQALHLRTLVQHEFFAPLMEKPQELWLCEGKVAASIGSPLTRILESQLDESISETPTSPENLPPVVKKLSFSDASLDAVCEQKTPTKLDKKQNELVSISMSSPDVSEARTPPSTPPKDDTAPIDITPRRSERRSVRVAAKMADSPRKLVKPDQSVMAKPIAPEVQELQASHIEIAKTPTPTKASGRKARRHTILPSDLESSLSEGLGHVNRSLASLLIEPPTSDAVEAPLKVVKYDPVPARWLGSPMVLPKINEEPLNWVDELREYMLRRAQRLEENRRRRKFYLTGFFVRTEEEIIAARASKLASKRRRRPTRKSMGAGRRSTEFASVASSRPRRKSVSSPNPSLLEMKLEEKEEVEVSPLEEVHEAICDFSSTLADSSAESEGMCGKVRGEAVLEAIPMLANELGLVTSPTVPRRSTRRRSSLSVSPLQSVVPAFSLTGVTKEAAVKQKEASESAKTGVSKKIAKGASVSVASRGKSTSVTAKATSTRAKHGLVPTKAGVTPSAKTTTSTSNSAGEALLTSSSVSSVAKVSTTSKRVGATSTSKTTSGPYTSPKRPTRASSK